MIYTYCDEATVIKLAGHTLFIYCYEATVIKLAGHTYLFIAMRRQLFNLLEYRIRIKVLLYFYITQSLEDQ